MYVGAKKTFDKVMKGKKGQFIKKMWKELIPKEWKPYDDDVVEKETFGLFGLYYHMLKKVKMVSRDVETDLASVWRNS